MTVSRRENKVDEFSVFTSIQQKETKYDDAGKKEELLRNIYSGLLQGTILAEEDNKKRAEEAQKVQAEQDEKAEQERKVKAEQESIKNITAGVCMKLEDAVESAKQSMENNPLYKADSNKLKLVTLLQEALQEVMRTSQQALVWYGEKEFEAEYKEHCLRSLTLANLIISHDTKTSHTAKFGKAVQGFLGEKPSEATEIKEFYKWQFTLPQGYVNAKTGESFRSLSDKVKQAEKSGVEGKTVLMDFIMPGLVQRIEDARQLFPDADQWAKKPASPARRESAAQFFQPAQEEVPAQAPPQVAGGVVPVQPGPVVEHSVAAKN